MSLHEQFVEAAKATVSPRARKARMALFVQLMDLRPGMRVIDLGGTPSIWAYVNVPLEIVAVNLVAPVTGETRVGGHSFTMEQGDATCLEYPDNSFDLVFSNSVIEHVGPIEKQEAFAREVRRLAPAYYVQTPSIAFPIEAHTHLPFWFYYPEGVRRRIVEHWLGGRRRWFGEYIGETRIVREATLRQLFPDGRIERERLCGMIKSNIVWRRSPEPESTH